MKESISYKDYFKARLMEGLMNEVFATDAQRATPEGGEMQRRHAGMIKGLIAKYNENPEQFKSVKAGPRLALMGRRLGADTQLDPNDHVRVNPDIVARNSTPGEFETREPVTSNSRISFNRSDEASRKDADNTLNRERGERLRAAGEAKRVKAIKDKKDAEDRFFTI